MCSLILREGKGEPYPVHTVTKDPPAKSGRLSRIVSLNVGMKTRLESDSTKGIRRSSLKEDTQRKGGNNKCSRE